MLMLLGIAVSAIIWTRALPKSPQRGVMIIVYAAGLTGALLGAKALYLIAEAPQILHAPNPWLTALYGKTITGALLGGYIGVELGKKLINHTQHTGDSFAIIVPVGLIFGRVGCTITGCCLGRACPPNAWYTLIDAHGTPRFPTAPTEAAFNLIAAVTLTTLYRRKIPALQGQLFHIYLIAYGTFRLLHEILRDTPRLPTGITPYQLIALAIILFATQRLTTRHKQIRIKPTP